MRERLQFKAPRWASWVLRADRAVERLARGVHVVRDEVLGSWLSPGDMEALTLGCYAQTTTYGPGGGLFEGGLFPWEEAVFASSVWPREGRLLVGGAGAGREALALAARGYEVVAFEPCEALASEGKRLAEGRAGLRFEEASYAELIAAVRGAEGPLAGVGAQGPFDAVVLGWTSLSHVIDPLMRLWLLEDVRRLCPRGPVLVSFLMPGPEGEAERRLRRALGWMRGGRTHRASFSHDAGFYCCFTERDIGELAESAGYRVERFDASVYPHAVLVGRAPT